MVQPGSENAAITVLDKVRPNLPGKPLPNRTPGYLSFAYGFAWNFIIMFQSGVGNRLIHQGQN